MTLMDVIPAALLGLIAGLLGGLAGIGGSMIMLPGLHMLFGDEPVQIHHRYMAAAMVVNVAVAFPAMLKHRAAGAVRGDLVAPLLTGAVLGIIGGVLVSNRFDGQALRSMLAAFIAGYSVLNLMRLIRRTPEPLAHHERVGTAGLVAAGGVTGMTAGLLGLGGGVVMVPLLQVACRVPLRQSIATSSAVICVTATVGAGLKLGTLHRVDESVSAALLLAALMAPTAIIGGLMGARLTHTLPIRLVRAAVTALLLLAAAKMAGLW